MEVKTWKHLIALLCCAGFFLALSRAEENDTRKAVVKFRHFFVLNCTTNSNSSSCDIQERSSHNYTYRDEKPTWKAFTFIVDYWSLRASCVVICNNERSSWETIVTVYQPPESIELYAVPAMEVGESYILICEVLGVAPLRDLTVTLLKGEEQLLVKTFEDHTDPEVGDVMLIHSIKPQEDDVGKTITCQATLDLRPTGPLVKNTSHGIYLWTPGAIAGAVEQISLELQKPSPGHRWAYHLICHVIRVYPCHSLVVTFFKGSKRLGTPSFTNCTWVETENYTVTLPVTLHPEDHGLEAYCHAAVRFGLQEPVYQIQSSDVPLKTAESYLAIVVAVTAVAALLGCVLVVFLIFLIKLWIN